MSPSRGTAAKSDAVLSERLTGQGEDARPAFGRREPACRGCAGSPGRAQEDNVEGGEGFHAGGEAPDSSAHRPARAALQAQTCSLPPPAPSSAGPGPGGRPLCQRQSHTLHALSPLGPRGPCVLPPSLCLRGTRRWGGDQRGPRGRRAVRESRVRWPGRPPGDTGASTESGESGERRSLPADEGDAVSDMPPLPTPVGQ